MSRVMKLPVFIWKLFVGTALCQFALTSIAAIGWTYRLMQRAAVKRWFQMSAYNIEDENVWLAADRSTHDLLDFPNWFLRQHLRENTRRDVHEAERMAGKARAIARAPIGSLRDNFVIGFRGVATTWSLTILPALLWVFGWYSGWDNSFNKGYEQFSVGMAISWTGNFLFIALMFYVPMAQARQAVTGEWRRFFDFQTMRALIRRRRVACMFLAVAYAVVSFPIMFLKTAPGFFPQGMPDIESMNASELLRELNNFYFLVSAVGFVAFVGLRLLATRIYAGAIIACVRDGEVETGALGAFERHVLDRLDLAKAEVKERPPLIVKVAKGTAVPLWRSALIALTALVWFSFVAQIYVSEFFVYHPRRGFMNQPLVQLPWFRYVPNELQKSANALKGAERDAQRDAEVGAGPLAEISRPAPSESFAE